MPTVINYMDSIADFKLTLAYMTITHRNFKISIFKDTVATASQLLISFLPDNLRFRRAKHLASKLDGLTFSSSKAKLRAFLNERRLSWQQQTCQCHCSHIITEANDKIYTHVPLHSYTAHYTKWARKKWLFLKVHKLLFFCVASSW